MKRYGKPSTGNVVPCRLPRGLSFAKSIATVRCTRSAPTNLQRQSLSLVYIAWDGTSESPVSFRASGRNATDGSRPFPDFASQALHQCWSDRRLNIEPDFPGVRNNQGEKRVQGTRWSDAAQEVVGGEDGRRTWRSVDPVRLLNLVVAASFRAAPLRA